MFHHSARDYSRIRGLGKCSTSALALLAIMGVTAPLLVAGRAQAAAEASTGGLEEIVVTAEKRKESVQDIPLTVAVFSQEQMNKRGAVNLETIQAYVPNLNFSIQSADGFHARVTIRGIGTETLLAGQSPGVGLYIDGVYQALNAAAIGDIFDVARVEVLKGPQGTLFGRNSNGGAVNIVSQDPVDKLAMSGDVTVGNYSEMRARGMVNVPISDNLSARMTIVSDSHKGYMHNMVPNKPDADDKDAHAARLKLRWTNHAGSDIVLTGYYEKMGGVGPGSRYLGTDVGTVNGYPANYAIGIANGPVLPVGGSVQGDAYNHPNPTLGSPVSALPTNLRYYSNDAPKSINALFRGVDMIANIKLNDAILLKSISSYQLNHVYSLADADSSALPLETRERTDTGKQWSQEFNLISQNPSAFKWVLGLYYFHEEVTEVFHDQTNAGVLDLSIPLPPGETPGGSGVYQNQTALNYVDSYAVFGQSTYNITKSLDFTLGARYTWDKTYQERHGGGRIDLTSGLLFNGLGAVGPMPKDSGHADFANWTGKAVLAYHPTVQNMLYASYSRGYKSGGLDFNGGSVTGGALNPYGPEKIDAYEIGSKNRFLNNRLQANLAAFYYNYRGMQIFRLGANGPLTDNAGKSTIKGIEGDFDALITDNFHVDASFGWLDAKYKDYSIPIPPSVFTGNYLNDAPKLTAHVGAEYTVPVDTNKNLIARIDYAYHGTTFHDRANLDFDRQNPYSLVNARLRLAGEKWHIDAFVNNIFDTLYVTAQLINPPFNCGCRTVNIGAPRTWGLTVGYTY